MYIHTVIRTTHTYVYTYVCMSKQSYIHIYMYVLESNVPVKKPVIRQICMSYYYHMFHIYISFLQPKEKKKKNTLRFQYVQSHFHPSPRGNNNYMGMYV